MLSHRNLLSTTTSIHRLSAHHRLPDFVRDLVALPLFHVTALTGQLLPTLASGGKSVIMAAFDVATFLRTIEAERIHSLVGAPGVFASVIADPRLSEVDVSSVQAVGFGGSAATPQIIAAIRKAFPAARLTYAYGMTETAGPLLFSTTEISAIRPDSVGFPAPVWQARIDAPGPDGVGELLVRGEGLMHRYWKRPEATAAALEDGWLHTGDLARVDGSGLVIIAGRKTDVAVSHVPTNPSSSSSGGV